MLLFLVSPSPSIYSPLGDIAMLNMVLNPPRVMGFFFFFLTVKMLHLFEDIGITHLMLLQPCYTIKGVHII